jgi:hypothetical protein
VEHKRLLLSSNSPPRTPHRTRRGARGGFPHP